MGAVAAAGGARAQSLVDSVINAPQRGWDDQFNSQPARGGSINSLTPILSPQTLSYVQLAVASYQQIVANGGWPFDSRKRQAEARRRRRCGHDPAAPPDGLG